jgi:hypothetical protein
MIMSRDLFIVGVLAALLGIFAQSAMARPLILASQADIDVAPASADDLLIRQLPVSAYPGLLKFRKLRRIDFYDRAGHGGNDERLRALANVGLRTVSDISLLNCPEVTDKGIEELRRFPALEELQLEGTSITDAGLRLLLSVPHIKGINVANCKGVTLTGLKELVASATLDGIGFSTENLNQGEVLALVELVKPNIKDCEITDVQRKLKPGVIVAAAKRRGVNVQVDHKGALQYIR